ncbi:MAG: DUF5615 family PIN-like protein [Planctomycetes bacterium]|nr:DUF5615 family PIN-like protein [Planctomycetota bacterium]
MISFLVDQNFNEHIVDGLVRRDPRLSFTLARDVGLAEVPDPMLLEWAGGQDLVLLSHDGRTIPPSAHARVAAGQRMSGVFLVDDRMPIGQAIEEIRIAAHCLTADDCKDVVVYFPL